MTSAGLSQWPNFFFFFFFSPKNLFLFCFFLLSQNEEFLFATLANGTHFQPFWGVTDGVLCGSTDYRVFLFLLFFFSTELAIAEMSLAGPRRTSSWPIARCPLTGRTVSTKRLETGFTVESGYIILTLDPTKVADISGWMIKPVGPNSSSKCRLYSEINQIR